MVTFHLTTEQYMPRRRNIFYLYAARWKSLRRNEQNLARVNKQIAIFVHVNNRWNGATISSCMQSVTFGLRSKTGIFWQQEGKKIIKIEYRLMHGLMISRKLEEVLRLLMVAKLFLVFIVFSLFIWIELMTIQRVIWFFACTHKCECIQCYQFCYLSQKQGR